ncbi:MAG: hypothetical protein J7K46_08115 [Bacteroidales bacterium]|nr:hypothetical protein [Bacteroidales bacterium]
MTRPHVLYVSVLMLGLSLSSHAVHAQEMQSLYFMRLPQANLMNPAHHPYCNFYLDLPVIGSANVSALNSSLTFSDIIFPGTGEYADSLITILHPSYNIDNFLVKLNKKNFLAPSLHTDILALGFRSKNLYFHINFSENVSAFLGYPKDLITLLLKGNESFMGGEADFSSLEFNASAYGSYAFGVTTEISPSLTMGVRGKFLSGIADVSLKNDGMSLSVQEEDYTHTVNADLSVNVSGPLVMEKDSAGNITDVSLQEGMDKPDNLIHYLLHPDNPGFAFDLGASYRINDRFSLSASVLNLGMIWWKRDVNNISSKGNFVFRGLDVSPVLNVNDSSSLEDLVDNLLDSVQTIFKPTYTTNPYTTILNPKVYVGGTLNLTENVYFGLLSKTEIHKKNILQSFTLSANASLSRFLDATVSYSYSNHSFNSLGAGLSLRGGPLQVYVLTDYALGLIHPDETEALGVWFGINLTFGCKARNFSDLPLIF